MKCHATYVARLPITGSVNPASDPKEMSRSHPLTQTPPKSPQPSRLAQPLARSNSPHPERSCTVRSRTLLPAYPSVIVSGTPSRGITREATRLSPISLQALLPRPSVHDDTVVSGATNAVKAKVHSLRSACDSVASLDGYVVDEQEVLTSVAGKREKPSPGCSLVRILQRR